MEVGGPLTWGDWSGQVRGLLCHGCVTDDLAGGMGHHPTMRGYAALVALVTGMTLVSGCGGGSEGTSYDSAEAVGSALGCSYEAKEEPELFATEGYCGDYEIAMFDGEEQRDIYLEVARGFRGNYVVGENFIILAHTPEDAEAAQEKVGGTVE